MTVEKRNFLAVACMTIVGGGAAGCFDIVLPENVSLIDIGAPYVMRGSAVLLDDDGPCLAWLGDDGNTYHLIQVQTMENELFDELVTPGTRSRLVLATRDDLSVACQVGNVAEVQNVLEVIGSTRIQAPCCFAG